MTDQIVRPAYSQDAPTEPRRDIMRWKSGTLHRNWYAACTADELTGFKPIGRTIMGEHLVVFRDADRQPVALADRCLHRAAKLSEGTVADGCVKCPYHGWAYDARGQVVHIPSEGPERCDRPGKKAESFPCLEAHGLVWVWLGEAGVAPTHEPFSMPWYQADGWKTYYMITAFENGVTNLAENFMDVPHTVFVHADWFRNEKTRQGDAICKRTERSVEIEYLHRDDIGFADWALNPDRLPMVHTDKFYMPNVTRVDYRWGDARHFVISSQITPVGELSSMVYTAIAFKFGALTPLLEPFFQWYTRQVIEQDVVIMRNQGENLRRYGEAKFMSTEADLVHLYIESLRSWAEKGEVGPRPAPQERRISFWI